ncbi:MAG: hypothetical protein AB3X44_12015 [Leptothrix sp. (in: b-proteobacteria)]
MKPRLYGVATVAAAMLSCLVTLAEAATPRAEALELDDKDRALVAKQTLKQRLIGNQMSGTGTSANCGSVEIGNTDTSTGSSRIANREKTIIVTGNIYNTATCKR